MSLLELAARFYRSMLAHNSERGARLQAEMYLRRKDPAYDAATAEAALRAAIRVHLPTLEE